MIRKTINKYDIHLYPVHLKRLLNKNPLLVKFYFEKYSEFRGKEYRNDDFLNYLCWKKPELYFDIGLSSTQYVKLGKRTTKTLLKISEQKVMKVLELNQDKLHLGQLIRQVTNFGKLYLPKLLPKNLDMLKRDKTQKFLRKILVNYPCEKRWNVISEAFALVYDKNLMEYLDYFTYANIIPLFHIEIRRKWGNLMYSKTSASEYWTYMDPKQVFELVKAKINVTSTIKVRIEFLNQLVSICHANNDYNTYGELLKYITQRHRNDDLQNILRSINSNYNPDNFTDIHWKYIGEILETVRIKGNVISRRIILDYLLYLAKNEISLDDTIKWFISDSIEHYLEFDFNVKGRPEDWEKVWRKAVEIAAGMEAKKSALSSVINFIVLFNKENKNVSIDLNQYEAAIQLFQDTWQLKEHYDTEDCRIIMSFLTYNNQNPQTIIRVCDDDQLVAVIKVLNKQSEYLYGLNDLLSNIFSKKNRTHFEMALLQYFVNEWCDHIPPYRIEYIYKALGNLIRNDPEIANNYFDLLLKHDSKRHFLDFGLLKKYSHLEFDQRFIKYHSETLAANSSLSDISKIIKGLALLMSSDNFLKLVSKYLPKNTKLDIGSDLNNSYRLQCSIIKRLQQVEEPLKVVPYLSIVCHDDYLKTSIPTMNNILNRINESAAYNFIDTLKNQPVSLRKHCVFSAFNFLPLHLAIDVYVSVSNKEKNVSMKNHLLGSILKIFIKNPVAFLLDIVLSKLDTLDKHNDVLLKKIAKTADRIPIRFKAAYIEKLWRTMDTFAVDDNDKFADEANKYRYILIEEIQKCFCNVEFSETFCKDFIGKLFLSVVDAIHLYSNNINKIVMDYLQSNNSQHFDFVFEIVKTFKEKYHNQYTKHLHSFFDIALSKLITYDANVLLQFEAYWKRIFSITEHFSGFCSLELLKLYKASSGNSRMFAEGIDRFFQYVILTYGPYVNLLLTECFRSFCKLDNSKANDSLLEDLTIDMLTINASPLNYFIGMNIARDSYNKEKKNQITQLISRQHDQLSEILYYSVFQ